MNQLLKKITHLYSGRNIIFYLPLILLFLSVQVSGQVCDGNLGVNIFPDGDFGSGNTNVVSTDPKIAPGYLYQPYPPPNDGYYTITNYTGLWNLFPGWIKIYDNSEDIFGYMMVVNASNEPGLFYEKEITGLCENTLYEFSADIINLLQKGSNMIKPDVSFLLDNDVKFNTGDVPEDETWHTYGFTFTTEPGQFSLSLSLQNNAPGGMGNDLALDNISFRPCGPEALILPEEVTDICEDGEPIPLSATLIGDAFETPTYQWQQSFDQGVNWSDIAGETGTTYMHANLGSGDYYYRFLVANGPGNITNYKCRIVSNEKIVRVIPKFTSINDSICQGLSYPIGDKEYSETGTYIDTLTNRLGCDSIITLDLFVEEDSKINVIPAYTDPSCANLTDGSFAIESVENGEEPYNYIFEDDAYGIDEKVYNLPAGEYIYMVLDRYGCSFSESITLENPDPFIIDLGPDMKVDLGDAVHLSPDANFEVDNYYWEPQELVNCQDSCHELDFVPPNSMYVTALGTSTNNCKSADSIYVTVNTVRKAYFPNAFSPNNDGLNDYFTVFGSVPNVQRVEKMNIYDRWGQLIFEQYDYFPAEPTSGWDGTIKGDPLAPGVFVYVIDIRFLDDEVIQYKGNVTLVR